MAALALAAPPAFESAIHWSARVSWLHRLPSIVAHLRIIIIIQNRPRGPTNIIKKHCKFVGFYEFVIYLFQDFICFACLDFKELGIGKD